RLNEDLARTLGVDVFRYKLLSFALGNALASFAGGLYGYYTGYIDPGYLGINQSMEILAMVLLGGQGTLAGPIVGSFVLTGLPHVIDLRAELRAVIAGLAPASEGGVVWKGEAIDRLRPDEIAARGLVKTFQNPQVFAELSVLDNVFVATHLSRKRRRGVARVAELVGGGGASEAGLRVEVEDVLTLCNLTSAMDQRAGNLS